METENRSDKARTTSVASISELVGEVEDQSLQRADDCVRLSKCQDEVFIANAFRYCKRYLSGTWASCSADMFSVQYLSGGLTNYLYLCSLPEKVKLLPNEQRKVLIRIYGEIVNRKQRFYEGVIFTLLSERGLGPRNYGVFNSGRIEQYFPYRHLFTRELADPVISKIIASKAAHYHCMKLPINKDPIFLWESFEKFLDMTSNITFKDEESSILYQSFKDRIDFQKECEWLKKMLLHLNSPVTFCHNDLQEGNLLYIKEENKTDIMVIDYDYSAYNYRGFDIGNHFREWMYEYDEKFKHGFTVYHDGYPTKEQQILFAEEYLKTLKDKEYQKQCGELDDQKYARNIPLSSVETLLYEANRFALASDLFWFLWSIIQTKISQIDFGFLEYADARLGTYILYKKSFGY